jgi:hypothetical protein
VSYLFSLAYTFFLHVNTVDVKIRNVLGYKIFLTNSILVHGIKTEFFKIKAFLTIIAKIHPITYNERVQLYL